MATLVRIEPALFRADEAWFVFDDGRKCLRKTEPRAPSKRSSFPAPMIRTDSIEPIMGPDMQMHDSLASYRRSLLPENNPKGERYIELGDERLTPNLPQFDERQRRDDIRAAIEDVKYGRVPPLTVLED